MQFFSHRTTKSIDSKCTRLGAIMMMFLFVSSSCISSLEVKTAKNSLYDTDFALVYTAVLDSVRQLYPSFDDDPVKGTVKTSWTQVRYSAGDDDSAAQRSNGTGGGGQNTQGATSSNPSGQSTQQMQGTANVASLSTKRYFIRFDISVNGGRPWRVRVTGHAAEWASGNAIPTELHGTQIPHWLAGRVNTMNVSIYRRLKPYAIPAPEAQVEQVDVPPPIDPTAYGAIPTDAGQALGMLQRAIKTRDYPSLRAGLDDEVIWSLGSPGGADSAMVMWQADPSTLDAMLKVIEGGCGADGTVIVCPAANLENKTPPWKLTMALHDKQYKVTSFVSGN